MFCGNEQIPDSVRLTNADFRRMLTTPRDNPSEEPVTPDSTKDGEFKVPFLPINNRKMELRKKRKQRYAQKEQDNRLVELAKIYRDRAQERRKGINQLDHVEDLLYDIGTYQAIAPDLASALDATEQRKRMIHESKYLGGDMEHTHLVKGLDFALLQKVRSEIEKKDRVQEIELNSFAKDQSSKRKGQVAEIEEKSDEDKITFKTSMARNVVDMVTSMTSKVVKRNELFAPGRMAYAVDVDEEYETGDIPTTVIRSKADVPVSAATSTLSTDDIVINKLTEILSYLRQGKRAKKVKGQRSNPNTEDSNLPKKEASLSIYDDIGDYVPSLTKAQRNSANPASMKNEPYFVKSDEESPKKNNEPCMPNISNLAAIADSKTQTKPGMKLSSDTDSYAECYPGLDEMNDTLYDSDEEVDFTKMDSSGNRKNLLSRWDFDTVEEYSEYMSKREATPKAAYQFGVKTEDGRRSQIFNKSKNDKNKFEKQWQQIQSLMCKRKSNSSGEGSTCKIPKNDCE